MKSNKLKMIALCALPFAGLASNNTMAATAANTGTINIATAINFYNTLNALKQGFLATHPSSTYSYSINIAPDSSTVLENAIIAGNGSSTYDLFLSADKKRPDDLVTNHPTLIIPGTEWLYSVGELEFWSPINNVSAGLTYPLTQNIVLADPSKAPYGTAAAVVLNEISAGAIAYPPLTGTTYPNGAPYVSTQPNISLTYKAISKTGSVKEGFINQSAICTQSTSGVKTFSPSTWHHTYPWNDATYPHPEIAQYGIKLVNTARVAGSGSDTLLTNFINYMNSPDGQNTIKKACYALTL
jgi:molybdate transport system substrate-binding protein